MSLKLCLSVEQSYAWHPGQEGLKGCISMPTTHITLTDARYHRPTVIFLTHMLSDSQMGVLMPERLLLYFTRILCVRACVLTVVEYTDTCVFKAHFSQDVLIICVSLAGNSRH